MSLAPRAACPPADAAASRFDEADDDSLELLRCRLDLSSRPAITSRRRLSPMVARRRPISRSQASEMFMFRPDVKLLEEAQIVVEEQPQIVQP